MKKMLFFFMSLACVNCSFNAHLLYKFAKEIQNSGKQVNLNDLIKHVEEAQSNPKSTKKFDRMLLIDVIGQIDIKKASELRKKEQKIKE